MTRIDFYILPDVDSESKFRFACRLAHRAIADGGQAHVRTASAEETAVLDALMWIYPEGRFLPHTTEDNDQSLVRIGHEEPPPGQDELLINLGNDVPAYFDRYQRCVRGGAGAGSERGACALQPIPPARLSAAPSRAGRLGNGALKVPHSRGLRPRAFSCEGCPSPLSGPGPALRSCNNRSRSLALPEAFIP